VAPRAPAVPASAPVLAAAGTTATRHAASAPPHAPPHATPVPYPPPRLSAQAPPPARDAGAATVAPTVWLGPDGPGTAPALGAEPDPGPPPPRRARRPPSAPTCMPSSLTWRRTPSPRRPALSGRRRAAATRAPPLTPSRPPRRPCTPPPLTNNRPMATPGGRRPRRRLGGRCCRRPPGRRSASCPAPPTRRGGRGYLSTCRAGRGPGWRWSRAAAQPYGSPPSRRTAAAGGPSPAPPCGSRRGCGWAPPRARTLRVRAAPASRRRTPPGAIFSPPAGRRWPAGRRSTTTSWRWSQRRCAARRSGGRWWSSAPWTALAVRTGRTCVRRLPPPPLSPATTCRASAVLTRPPRHPSGWLAGGPPLASRVAENFGVPQRGLPDGTPQDVTGTVRTTLATARVLSALGHIRNIPSGARHVGGLRVRLSGSRDLGQVDHSGGTTVQEKGRLLQQLQVKPPCRYVYVGSWWFVGVGFWLH